MRMMLSTLLAALLLVGCSESGVMPETDAATEEVAPTVSPERLAEIKQLEDRDALYAIIEMDTMFSETGKAADARLTELLRPEVAKATKRELFDLEHQFAPGPGSALRDLFRDRKAELE